MSAPSQIGRYRILGVLGRGTFGTLYHARDDALQREVALKVLEGAPVDDDIRSRFHHVARLLSRLQHPNVHTLYEVGEHQGVPYMAFELLRGTSLSHAINAGISLESGLPIILQVLAGLDYVHQQGVVHRDVKPATIFIPNDGPVTITDFGVARFPTAAPTGTGNVVGTAGYMSPEQVRGKKVDGRSDLFSVGCILYELVTGRRPFHSDNLMAIFWKTTQQEPDWTLLPQEPQWVGLSGVIARALRKNPEDRYPDAHAMSAELQVALTHLGESADWVAPRPPAAPAQPV